MKPVIGHARREDLRLVTDSWCKSFLGQSRRQPRGSGPLRHMDRGTYFRKQTELIDGLVRRPGTALLVLHPEETPEHVLGWVCGCPSSRVLHFIYVGSLYRQLGYATALMAACFVAVGQAPITVTHWSRCVPFYLRRWDLRYDPYEPFERVRDDAESEA